MLNLINPEIGDGAVAMFRWFSDGENWVYHPWYTSRRLELVKALDSQLKQRNENEFVIQALGGYLVGELLLDQDCPDPRAKGRSPCILRVAFFHRQPTLEDKAMMIQELRKITSNGTGASLQLYVAPPSTPKVPAASNTKRNLLPQLLGLVFVLSVFGVVLYFLINSFGEIQKPAESKKTTDEEVRLVKELLIERKDDKTEVESAAKEGHQKLTHRLAYFFSQEGQKVLDKMKGNHPDTVFLKRLPEKPIDTNGGLRTTLSGLELHLIGNRKIDATQTSKDDSVADLIAKIRRQTDYARWWNEHGSKLRRYANDEVCDESVSRIARRWVDEAKGFSKADAAWQKPYAKAMQRELTKRWQVEGVTAADVDTRPWFVIQTFLHFLSREHLPPAVRGRSWPEEYVLRLPEFGPDFTKVNSPQSIRTTLVDLLKRFNEDAEPGSTEDTLVSSLGESREYDAWLKTAKKSFSELSEKADELPSINSYVDRFRSPNSKR